MYTHGNVFVFLCVCVCVCLWMCLGLQVFVFVFVTVFLGRVRVCEANFHESKNVCFYAFLMSSSIPSASFFCLPECIMVCRNGSPLFRHDK